MSDKIQVTFIQNPWEPYESRVIEYLPASAALPIEKVAGFIYPLVIADGLDIVGSINGRLYENKEEMKHVLVNPGDNVVFSVVPRGGGGGGGKNPLKMVAIIAVSVLAMYAGQVWMTGMLTGGTSATTVGGIALSEFSVASMGYTLTGAGMLVAGATSFAVNAIGGMLINALIPTSLPTTDLAGLDAANSSPTYGWDTGSNVQQEGRALPVLYGKMRVTPPLISKHISLDGEDQYLHLLYAVADGQIDSISGIELNGEPVAHFESVDIETRLGTNDQTVIPFFNDTYMDHGVGVLIEDTFIFTTTGNSAEGLGVGIDFRYGLYYSTDRGDLGNNSCNYRIEYRKVGDTDWILMVEATATAAQRESYKKYHRVDNIPMGQYEVRVTRLSPADSSVRYSSLMYFDYTQEIMYDDFSYPNVALLCLRILANSQLSGGIPTVTCLAERATVQVWDGTQYVALPANKPAWACYDILHNSLYGVGADVSRIPYKEFKRWADWTDTKSITSNIYMDTTLSLLSALAQISVLGRGSVIQRGMNFGVIVDKPGNPVQTFTVGNIITDSYSEEFLGSEDLSNAVEMTYWPEEKNYERSMLEVRTDTFDTSDEDVKKSQITLLGCTDTATAVCHAKYMLNCNKYLRRTVSFGAAVEAIACQPGDIIRVSHDVPQWGYGGRVVSGNSNTIKLDRKVSMEPGKTYSVLVRQRYEADAWSQFLIYNSGDYALHEGVIYKALQGSNNKEPGYEEDYWEAAAERIEQKTVASVSVATVTDTLVLTSPWTVVPSRFDVYTFGEQNKLVKEFRVIDIVKSQDFVCNIKGLEYRSEVYQDDGGSFTFVQETDLYPIRNLQCTEVNRYINGVASSFANLTWYGQSLIWYVYKRVSGTDSWIYEGETHVPHYQVGNLEPGRTYDFLVTTTSVSRGLTTSLFFNGGPNPPQVTGLYQFIRNDTPYLAMDKADIGWPVTYVIRKGESWANGRLVGESQDNIVEIDGPGTYFAAIRCGVSYSQAVSISVVMDGLVSNVIASYEEADTAWSGTRSDGIVIINNNLWFVGTGDIMSMTTDLFQESNLFSTGNIPLVGTYTIPSSHIIEIDEEDVCNVTVGFSLRGDPLNDDLFDVPDLFNLTEMFGDYGNKVSAIPEIQVYRNNSWSYWATFQSGMYAGKKFNVRLVINTTDVNIIPIVSSFGFSVDVPDKFVQQKGVVVPDTGYTFTFSRAFNSIPTTIVQILDAQTGDIVYLPESLQTKTDGFVQIKNGGVGVSRRVNLIHQGY